jgi:CheY-like chemotaxis protein
MANILVVDDNEDIRDLIEMILTEDNHDVTTAKDGKEGLAIFKENTFDLVITDILMPDTDGIELIIELTNSGNKTPIIAMSGGRGNRLTPDFNLSSAETLGAQLILTKPFSAFTLRRAINKVLK